MHLRARTLSRLVGLGAAVSLLAVPLAGAAAPVLSLPAPIVQYTSGSSATVTYTATAADGGTPVPVTCAPPSGASFPRGQTTVNCSADDGSGNVSTGSFTVTIVGPPQLALPGNITQNVDNVSSAAVSFSATASDELGSVPVTCTPASGSSFPLGTTSVSCSATNPAGTSNGGFTVTVQDTTAPAAPGITGGPTGFTNDTTPTFSFSAVSGATGYYCSVDDSSPNSACTSPFTPSALGQGLHTFYVAAHDAVPNTSAVASRSFTVDTTPPTLTLPNITVSVNDVTTTSVAYSGASASDASGIASFTCSPPSGSSFGLGTATVNCTATDNAGNPPATGSFTVTVSDTTPPPRPGVSGPSGTITDNTPTFTFSSAGATSYRCAVDNPAPSAACTSPYTTPALGEGSHTLYVVARDAVGNLSGAGSATVTIDTTAPVPAITSAPSGTQKTRTASIAFSAGEPATFQCELDGGGFAGCSSPAALSGLADGSHTFRVRATDAAGNASAAPAAATWSVDATPPVVSLTGSTTNVEANGPQGASVAFAVTASDNGIALLPSAIACDPPSGRVFPLGATTVECRATDAAGNVGFLRFDLTVADTTPPAINAPDVTIVATSADGILATDPAIAKYLAGISATDLVSTPVLTTNAPASFPIGATTLAVTAVDAAGNVARKAVVVTVLKPGSTAPPVDLTPPPPVSRATAKAGDHLVALRWANPSRDLARVEVRMSVVGEPLSGGRLLYKGTSTTFTAKGLRNDVEYRFVLIAFDRAGNSSTSVVVSATPRALLLARPKPSEKVVAPPLLRWTPVAGAAYFNVQLYRGRAKILSSWPNLPRLQLGSAWTYDTRKYRLTPGTYTWYVWPGLGARAEARYGQLLGKSTFVVTAGKAAKKT